MTFGEGPRSGGRKGSDSTNAVGVEESLAALVSGPTSTDGGLERVLGKTVSVPTVFAQTRYTTYHTANDHSDFGAMAGAGQTAGIYGWIGRAGGFEFVCMATRSGGVGRLGVLLTKPFMGMKAQSGIAVPAGSGRGKLERSRPSSTATICVRRASVVSGGLSQRRQTDSGHAEP
ncbi:hypothetical protein C8Q77DRAFT_1071227 [Trametes polyzona]|nr:hypothetical protein C8Q77DRAFT_1071227 [Trametes polyzona]